MNQYIKVFAILAGLLLALEYYRGAEGLLTSGGGLFNTVWRGVTGQNAAGTAPVGYAK